MKKISLVFNIVLLILVGVLFYLHFKTVDQYAQKKDSKKSVEAEIKEHQLKISYVNLDSLEANYTYFQEKSAALNKKRQNIQKELATKSNSIQQDIKALQKKAATLTMSQGKAAEKKILEKRQQLQKRQQKLQQELMKQQQEFNQELHSRLDQFLKRYNFKKKYDFIFAYSSEMSPLLYKNRAYNITQEVIKGLNAEEKTE